LTHPAGTPDDFSERKIRCGRLVIGIEFPNHVLAPPGYIENLQTFVKKCQEAAEKNGKESSGVGRPGLDSQPTTQALSDANTPRERPLYYSAKIIGEGAFGRVYKAFRARDGMVFAAKTFNPSANQHKRRRDDADPEWLIKIRREFALTSDNPHVRIVAYISAFIQELIILQPNVVRMVELRETAELPAIIMDYFPLGNIVDAGTLSDDQYVSALGQLLDGLSHLHAKGVVHRDLKPENFLIEMDPLFKIVIADFGLAKVVAEATLLKTFCGSLKYIAPEVFLGLNFGYGPLVDVWSLGVIALEWVYETPEPPHVPKSNTNEGPSAIKLYDWIRTWADRLLKTLEDQEDDQVIQILRRMIEVKPRKRWSAARGLAQGFRTGLFKRRVADGLVVCASVVDGPDPPLLDGGGDDGAKTPNVVSFLSAGDSTEATVVLGDMWGGGRVASSH
jgi:serine/threonine protein kinase